MKIIYKQKYSKKFIDSLNKDLYYLTVLQKPLNYFMKELIKDYDITDDDNICVEVNREYNPDVEIWTYTYIYWVKEL